ncbi:MAG TPA: type II toxin-antitoxin system HicA family toxin [Burkholderiaceae bacterium]|nr:type II toxin-antitoxin system HicA family toxin [Burkholderiaceae bacterium]
MSRHHAHLIRTIFQDPPSHNIHWREIESLLKHVGAAMDPLSGARVRVTLHRMEEIVHRPHHGSTMAASAIVHLRGFLARAGVTPSQYESKDDAGAAG